MNSFSGGKFFRLLSIALMTVSCGRAQKTFSLTELTDSAQRHLPELMQKKALVAESKSAVQDLRHQFLPLLRASAQVDLGSDNAVPGSYFPMGIVPSTSSGIYPENNAQAALGSLAILYGQYTLVDFGYRKASIASAESASELQSAEYEQSRYQIRAAVCRLYLNTLRLQMQLNIAGQNLERYRKIYDVIRALAGSGIKAGSDSSLARAEWSKAQTGLNQALGNLRNSREQLSYYTGIPGELLRLDSLSTSARPILPSDDSITSGNNPLLVYYSSVNRLYAADEKRISRGYQPVISLVASGWMRASSISPVSGYGPLKDGLGAQRYNYLAGISLQYDLFSGLHRKDKLTAMHFQQEAGLQQFRQQELDLESAARQASLNIQTAEENLQELPVQTRAARNVYDQKIAQYKAGMISLIDLTNAAFVLYRSQYDFSVAISDWWLARLDRAVATGNLELFIQRFNP